MYIVESKVKMLSPDGLGRMWDKDANGYARGEGVGAVILKTLSQALADNDHIECVIRETGLNQDGATTGLTMPSAAAQRELIHSTYRKAGLDLNKPSDRPQFFEAHGTGTPAGDPVEAEAICRAFFTESGEENNAAGINTLHVGSIKTVLGHTEGTAGIAALLKASLALQNSTLPPNLLFNSLNPDVLPFYNHLEIPKSPKAWPQIGTDTEPRRASVNSFGFGGTNAHAILESYVKPSSPSDGSASDAVFTPFVFSAASELSLRSTLAAFATHLENNPRSQTSAKDLAYTLRERRSVFSYRASFSAKTAAELEESISSRLQDTSSNIGTRMLGKAAGVHSRILGVFTGQGAQYARMGAELVRESSSAHQVIQMLDKYLAELPDAPTWSLEAELLAGPENSHVSEAAISQPLCTAIQIMVVSVLRSAGVQFDAVVGHSSGEIAAAYAADFLTARDAICVAYYRGLHCRHACSPNGEGIKGAMMAVGTTMEDALELCGMEETKGRVGLAAVNSSSNVTLSGDEDAIEELRAVLSDENRFNRRLKVDQAYHSKHMLPCSEPYVESLRRAGIKAQKSVSPSSKPCTWFSSVYDGKAMECSSSLNGTYWTDNMTRPVLFAQAIKAASMALAAEGQSIDAAVEVGPHAALRGPASQTLEEALGKSVPYTGTLVRGQDSVASLSTSLGFLWCHLDKSSIDLGSCERTLSGQSNFTVLKGLPSYQWNHSRHWFESRRSRRLRLRSQPFHPLLGNPTPETSAHVMRWKNVLKPSEIPWVEGHQVQGQIVFPAAGVCIYKRIHVRQLTIGSST
jgi:acyl transferase domain-containing protein